MDVDDFYLEPMEVTQRNFFEFTARIGREGWRAKLWPKDLRPQQDRLDWPVTNVTFDQATEYAAWRGCRLPSEAELEWAARGSRERRVPDGLPQGTTTKGPEWISLHRVGGLPADRVETPSGPVFDLFANAGELTQFRYRPYPGTIPGTDRSHWIGNVVRSGLIFDPVSKAPYPLGYVLRTSQIPLMGNELVGFRCARSLRPRLITSISFLSGGDQR